MSLLRAAGLAALGALTLSTGALLSGCPSEHEQKTTQPPIPEGYGAQGWGTATDHPARAGFDTKCGTCHTIGAGVRFGPDLAGIFERREEAWLARWVKDPGALRTSDPVGQAVAAEWKHLPPMPNLMLPDQEIAQLLDYIRWAEEQGGEEEVPLPTLALTRVPGPLGTDPDDPAWELAPVAEVPLQAQNVAAPMNPEVTVHTLRVQALTDGADIAFRLAWPDATLDANVDAGRFTDAAAVQLPLAEAASPMMGGAEAPVLILHWKALWQKDLDEGFQDVQDVHPNFWSDLYWFAEGEFPYPIPKAFEDERSRAWFPALQAGNPMARHDRAQPVEEAVAAGFGSLTARAESDTTAEGRWERGSWAVVVKRPVHAGGLDLGADGDHRVSFAVWDGSAGQVGGRKQWSDWVAWEELVQ